MPNNRPRFYVTMPVTFVTILTSKAFSVKKIGAMKGVALPAQVQVTMAGMDEG